MRLTFQYGDEQIALDAEPDGDGWRIRLPAGTEHRIAARRLPGNVLEVAENWPPPPPIMGEPASPRLPHGTPGTPPPQAVSLAPPLLGAGGAITRTVRLPFARTEDGRVQFSSAGHTYAFAPETGRGRRRGVRRSSGSLAAPMVGVVAAVLVQEGQAVEAHQPLAVIEAMKVLATIEAPFAGVVKRVHVETRQRVDHGAPVVEIEPAAAVAEEGGGKA